MVKKAAIMFSEKFWCVYAQSGGAGWFADPNAFFRLWSGEPSQGDVATALREALLASRELDGKTIMSLFQDSSELGWEEMLEEIASTSGYKTQKQVQAMSKEIWTRSSDDDNYLQATISKGESVKGLDKKIELTSFDVEDLGARIFEISNACR